MKRILFGITSLDIGGAERVLIDLSNKLSDDYEITIFSIYDNGVLKKELNKKVKFKSLYNKSRYELSLLKRIWSPIRILLFSKKIYRRYIKNDYDVEISFLEGPITRLFSNKNNNTKKIAWIHNDIKKVFGKGIKARIKSKIDKSIYSKYDKLVFVSKDNMNSFKEVYQNVSTNKFKVIYNYLDDEAIIRKADENNCYNELEQENCLTFVSVARLVEQKAIDRFIRIHKRLIDQGYNHKVYIIGDGPEKENLENLIKEYGVTDTFKLLGQKENPYPFVKSASYFCLLSYFEGYGMVLDEAKILNKKIIITDTAAREALKGYSAGLVLKNDEKSIYDGLERVITGKEVIKDSKEYKSCNEKNYQDVIAILEED